ncbi:MAG TPA: twin-arginine translocase TatA/TatE family subunit [bacterium]|nr:twin-arginine translocase TatA/TatE family subunit [bacterium]
MFGLGPMELIIVFLVVLLIFGAKRIPEIAQGLGKGITEFKKAARDVTDEIETAANVPVPPATHVKNELKEEKPSDDSSQQS